MEYPKIHTLWKRDKQNKFRIIDGDFSKQEFANIKNWLITEKIDGKNIRVLFNRNTESENTIRFDGKTDNAQIPTHLYNVLKRIFSVDLLSEIFKEPAKVILYGEGYGAKVHKGGGLYSKDAGFILFDVWIDGWWLERESIDDIAKNLNIKSVPILGIMDYQTAIEFVKTKPNSFISQEPKIMEGIVARSYPLMLFRNHTPIMWKIKVSDFDV